MDALTEINTLILSGQITHLQRDPGGLSFQLIASSGNYRVTGIELDLPDLVSCQLVLVQGSIRIDLTDPTSPVHILASSIQIIETGGGQADPTPFR